MQNHSVITTQINIAMMSLITLSYFFGFTDNIPCQSNPISSFIRNFIHVSPTHLLANMYAFNRIQAIETTLGSAGYAQLILILATLQTLIEMLISYYTSLHCSIGFSGVLYGLFSWSIVSKQQTSYQLLGILFFSILTASMQNSQLSLIGHLMGFISGIVVALFQNFMIKNQ